MDRMSVLYAMEKDELDCHISSVFVCCDIGWCSLPFFTFIDMSAQNMLNLRACKFFNIELAFNVNNYATAISGKSCSSPLHHLVRPIHKCSLG